MVRKELIINASTAETRIALLEEGILAEIFVERPENVRNVGDIYLGRVRKVLPGMSAAFIDIGWKQDAFLHFNDASNLWDDDELDQNRDPKKINLKQGQEIQVQVTKEPISGKGPRVTSELSLPGRFVVVVPKSSNSGVSRKIRDPREKKRIRELIKEVQPEGFGLIVRTVAAGKSSEVLERDINSLVQLWKKIEKKSSTVSAPAMIYKEVSLASSVIRDLFNSEIELVLVDSKPLYKEIITYLNDAAPQLIDRVSLYRDKEPIFDKYKIESEIEKGIRRRVWVEGGGHIVIEHTEAMVTIDVNSGKFIGKKDHEGNNLRVNLNSARAVCRQLRLRDIGGIIVVDFIDMWDEKNKKKVHDEMKKELKKDRAKTDVTPIGPFGLLVMTRQRIKPSLLFTYKENCPSCHGTGMVASRETIVTELERWISRFRLRSNERRISLHVHPDLHEFLTEGAPFNMINRIMLQRLVLINMVQDASIPPSEFEAYSLRHKRKITDEYRL